MLDHSYGIMHNFLFVLFKIVFRFQDASLDENQLQPPEYLLLAFLEIGVIIFDILTLLTIKLPFDAIELRLLDFHIFQICGLLLGLLNFIFDHLTIETLLISNKRHIIDDLDIFVDEIGFNVV